MTKIKLQCQNLVLCSIELQKAAAANYQAKMKVSINAESSNEAASTLEESSLIISCIYDVMEIGEVVGYLGYRSPSNASRGGNPPGGPRRSGSATNDTARTPTTQRQSHPVHL